MDRRVQSENRGKDRQQVRSIDEKGEKRIEKSVMEVESQESRERAGLSEAFPLALVSTCPGDDFLPSQA